MVGRNLRLYMFNVRSSRGVDLDVGRHLVLERVREELLAGERASQEFDVERFNYKRTNAA
jgi:hypothetical protein